MILFFFVPFGEGPESPEISDSRLQAGRTYDFSRNNLSIQHVVAQQEENDCSCIPATSASCTGKSESPTDSRRKEGEERRVGTETE